MLEQILFPFYLVLLILAVVFIGFNYYKIKDKYKTNPDIVLFLIPFILNVRLLLFSTFSPSSSLYQLMLFIPRSFPVS